MIKRDDLIKEVIALIEKGDITDIESYAYVNRFSRTKAVADLRDGNHVEIFIGKRGIFIKKED